jgi:hypothetical protein
MSEDTLILYPKKSSAVLLLLVCFAFVIIGIYIGTKEGWKGYLCAAFFTLGIPISIIQLMPGSTYLQLDQSGFTFCNMFRKTTISWSVVDKFFVVNLHKSGVKIHSMVGLNFIPSYDRSKLGRRISKGLADCEGSLPDTYGEKAEVLADLMNTCLRKARTNTGK